MAEPAPSADPGLRPQALGTHSARVLADSAFLVALFKARPSPFYILDEVEAALDDVNLRRFISFVDNLRSQTQFIIVTHQRRTMEMADVLYGVSMQADGVTKVVSEKLGRALMDPANAKDASEHAVV